MTATTVSPLDAALNYAARGWPIFPVRRPRPDGRCSCDDPGCTVSGKHPHIKEWPDRATTDEATIRDWWKRWPDANIGALANGRIVLDVDPRHGGDESLADLIAAHGPLPNTQTILTGGGGQQYICDAAGAVVKNNAGDLAPGLDIKTNRGLILLPPSLHRSGRRYEWEASSHPDDVPIAAIPAWLLDRIKASQSRGGTWGGATTTEESERIPAGQRNKALFRVGCAMRRHGVTETPIVAALLEHNAERCDPPLHEDEVRKIAASCIRYDPVPELHATFSVNDHAAHSNGHGGDTTMNDETIQGRTLPILDAGDHHLPRITSLTWAALHTANDPPRLFRFGGLLARIERDDRDTPLAVTLTEDRLRHEVARAANWERAGKTGAVPALPPLPVVHDLLATPNPPLPILDAITEVPTFAPDGSLQSEAGYHPRGRTYYAPPAGFAVPAVSATPTTRDIAQARLLINDELLGDFPFTGNGERAHAIGLLLLPFARALIAGPTPLHLIEKPQVGTGATLLADMLTYPVSGKPITAMTEGRDEDEWRKRLTARLRSGPAAILIDNLRERLDAAALAAALTSRDWEDRLLGTSDTIRLPVRCSWIATGNNPALSSEIARRTIRIRLDAHSDQPWLRRDFRHPDLRAWATHHRAELVWSALTLVAAWLAADKPIRADAPRLGMFEDWSRVIGGILEVAGIPGFLANVEDLYAHADTEGAAIRALLEAWWDSHATVAVGAADLWPLVESGKVEIDLGNGSERALKIRFGQFLGKLRDRQYVIEAGPVQVISAGTTKNAAKWKLHPPGRAG